MIAPATEMFTVGQIADKLEEPVPRVAYIISKLRLKPVYRANMIRLFNETQIEIIRKGIYNIQIHTHRGIPA